MLSCVPWWACAADESIGALVLVVSRGEAGLWFAIEYKSRRKVLSYWGCGVDYQKYFCNKFLSSKSLTSSAALSLGKFSVFFIQRITSFCWGNKHQNSVWWAPYLNICKHQICAFGTAVAKGAPALTEVSQRFLIPVAAVGGLRRTMTERTGRLSAGKIALDFTTLFSSLPLPVPHGMLIVCIVWRTSNQKVRTCSIRAAARLVFCCHLVLNLQCQWVDFFISSIYQASCKRRASSLVPSQV